MLPRRLLTVIALSAGIGIAAAITFATPALAKGPSQARITGPGLARPIVVSGSGEPGQPGALSTLATQTGLFTSMWGPNALAPPDQAPVLHTPPPQALLGPRYTIAYTVPGVPPQPGEQYGQIRQDLYPYAVGGPVSYTPHGQQGFSGPIQYSGWLRASPHLARTLARLGVPARSSLLTTAKAPRAARRVATRPASSRTLLWLIASAALLAAALLAGAALRLHHHKPTAHGAVSP